MATTLRLDHTSYPTSLAGGAVPGDAATGHVQRLFIADWMNALEPYETELYTRVKRGKTIKQRKYEWGQGVQTPHKTTAAGAVTAAATAIPVPTGNGAFFQVYHVVKNMRTQEIFIVSSILVDTLTVMRGQSSSVAAAMTAGDPLEIIGIAEPQLQDHPKGPITYGDISHNYTQRFATGLEYDEEARVTPNWEIEGDQLIAQMKVKGRELKLLVEKSMIHGGRQAGNPSGPIGSTFGGFQTFLTSNVIDLTNAPLSLYDIEDMTANVWDRNGGTQQTLLMSMKTKRIVSATLGPHREATVKDDSINLTLKTMKLDTGDYTFTVSRYIPDGMIVGADLSTWALHPYQGLDWHTKVHETDGDYSWHSMSATMGFSVQKESQQFIIKGFDPNLSSYPRMAI